MHLKIKIKMVDYTKIFEELITHVESEVVEYKAATRQFDTDKMGKYMPMSIV